TPAEITGLNDAAAQLLSVSPAHQTADGYQFDLVNVVRQMLAYESDNTRARLIAAYKKHDLPEFRRQSDRLLSIISDLDELVATRHEYLLGPWIHDARAWAADPTEADYYERDA